MKTSKFSQFLKRTVVLLPNALLGIALAFLVLGPNVPDVPLPGGGQIIGVGTQILAHDDDDEESEEVSQSFLDCMFDGRTDGSRWRRTICGIGSLLVGAAAAIWGPAATALVSAADAGLDYAEFKVKGREFKVSKARWKLFGKLVAAAAVTVLSYKLCMCGDLLFRGSNNEDEDEDEE